MIIHLVGTYFFWGFLSWKIASKGALKWNVQMQAEDNDQKKGQVRKKKKKKKEKEKQKMN